MYRISNRPDSLSVVKTNVPWGFLLSGTVIFTSVCKTQLKNRILTLSIKFGCCFLEAAQRPTSSKAASLTGASANLIRLRGGKANLSNLNIRLQGAVWWKVSGE